MNWSAIAELAALAGAPLILAVIGELLLQRSGMINIGLDGLMLFAALGAVVGAAATGSAIGGVLAAICASALLAALFGIMTIKLGTDQIVTGAALNFVAIGITGFIYGHSREVLAGTSATIDSAALVILFAWGVAPLAAAVTLSHTRLGLRIRAAGDYPDALTLQGMPVAFYRWTALALEALLAGVAGSLFSLMLAHGFAENMTAGRGFIALAIVILGRWKPAGAVAATALFSLTIALQYAIQAGSLKLQFHLLLALPYLATLLILAAVTTRSRAPRWLGKNSRIEN